jgi:CRP-like cAMP-binding protein
MSTTVNLFRHSLDGIAYRAGQLIFVKGQTGEAMYVLQEGEVAIMLDDLEIDRHGPGAIFGEMALIDSGPRSATAVALSDCRVIAIGPQRFEFLVQQTPHFATTVMRIMVERLRRHMATLAGEL